MPAEKDSKQKPEHIEKLANANIGKKRSPEFVERRRAQMKELWAKMTPEERAARKTKMGQAWAKAGREGSKIEKDFFALLVAGGVTPEMHRKIAGNLVVDLYLPKYNIVVEMDGPTHHTVITTVEDLLRVQASDAKKDATLVSMGIKVVRVRFYRTRVSKYLLKNFAQFLIGKLDGISTSVQNVFTFDLEQKETVSDARRIS